MIRAVLLGLACGLGALAGVVITLGIGVMLALWVVTVLPM